MGMNLKSASMSCPDPSPLLSALVSEIVVEEEISHHTITIPEPHVCRICEPDDEDENGEALVELGCKCKGSMSKMHRTCFLQWFGIRMLLQDNLYCEVCNSMLPLETQMVMAEAVGDQVNGGRRILLKGLKPHLGVKAFALTERAVDYEELVQVLIARNAPAREHTAIDVEMQAHGDQRRRIFVLTLGVVGGFAIGAMAITLMASLMGRFPFTFVY